MAKPELCYKMQRDVFLTDLTGYESKWWLLQNH